MSKERKLDNVPLRQEELTIELLLTFRQMRTISFVDSFAIVFTCMLKIEKNVNIKKKKKYY